jgi:type IV pilus assembly protein PilE
MPNNQRGFTLTEVLVVVAIIGILSAIALPSYRSYIMKSNRVDAFEILNEILQAQERFAADAGTYTTDLTDLGYTVDAGTGGVLSSQSLYSVSAAGCGAGIGQCVVLTATAQDAQTNDQNGNSGNISLSSRGEKTGWKDG